MWDYDSIYAKAALYFSRAREHPRSDDDEFGIWALLGLEFLLRAPLAQIHPSLLAAPEGDSLLHAVGIMSGGEPKSIPTKAVIARLQHVVPDFDIERQKDATILMNLRNVELHTGLPALANATVSFWLPRFLMVAEVLCRHLNLDIEALLGAEVVAQAKSLVAEKDQRVAAEVNRKIGRAKEFISKLQPEELAARQAAVPVLVSWGEERSACPACGSTAILSVSLVRTTDERLQDGDIVQDEIYVAQRLQCSVCGLDLENIAQIAAAGVQQLFTRTSGISLEERYLESSLDFEYGND